MSKQRSERAFYRELQHRIRENKRLYRDSSFQLPDSDFMRFTVTYLGFNPWKVIVPVSAVMVLVLRLLFGVSFSEFILDILGGK